MTNSESEEWFYLVMVAIEGECADSINIMEDINTIIECVNKNNNGRCDNDVFILNKLNDLNIEIGKSCNIIKRMYEKCVPEHFYNVLRIFLGGYSDEDVFPDGLKVDTYNGIINVKSKGGLAAHSTLIQLWDAFLGVNHQTHGKDFLMEMREYMPSSHRDYLEDFEKRCYLKDYIKDINDNDNIAIAYKKCINTLSLFRKCQLKIVHDYIMKMKKDKYIHEDKGTDGTELNTFFGELSKNVQKTLTGLFTKNDKETDDFQYDNTNHKNTNRFMFRRISIDSTDSTYSTYSENYTDSIEDTSTINNDAVCVEEYNSPDDIYLEDSEQDSELKEKNSGMYDNSGRYTSLLSSVIKTLTDWWNLNGNCNN